ncbi:hypothetical protein [Pengzhenrongella sp.]|uniref:hypothetical protein n=1 Tax=Pengzhenrongella sp. TaxID=2888820 RepID=UPI002F9342A2
MHALLSPSIDLVRIIPAHFGTRRTTESMAESRAEVDLLLRLMDLTGTVQVADGHSAPCPTSARPSTRPEHA